MNHDFETALEESLALLQSGGSVDECLQRFPQYAEELRPLLETAGAVSAVYLPAPEAAAIRRSRARMLQEADKQFAQQAVSISLFSRYVGRFINLLTGKETLDMKTTTRFAFTLVMLAVFIVSGIGVNLASANALPGDALYPAKRFFEKARLTFTVDSEKRVEVERQLQERRREEVRTVLEMQRQVEVEFSGELTDFNESTWTVGGFTLQLNANTEIQGTPQIGVIVAVRAVVGPNGGLQAESLAIMPMSNPVAYPGPGETASPMPTHTSMPSKTPMFTHTPMPSETPMFTGTPEHTQEPSHTPMGSPMPSETPEHTQEPGHTPMSSPMPSETPEHTQEPSHTPEQEHTPMPSSTPEHTPQHTPMPSSTPEHTPQHTPMPSSTPEHTPMPSETPESTQEPSETPEHTQEPSETPEHTPMPSGTPHP